MHLTALMKETYFRKHELYMYVPIQMRLQGDFVLIVLNSLRKCRLLYLLLKLFELQLGLILCAYLS